LLATFPRFRDLEKQYGSLINAITWSSTKFSHRAPEGYVLMRVFFGGSRNPGAMELDDACLLITARRTQDTPRHRGNACIAPYLSLAQSQPAV